MQPGERAFDTAVGSRVRSLRCWWLVALVGLMAASPSAGAATLFVTTRGSDAGRCARALPCRHVRRAVAVAHTGDTIELGRGEFVENVTLPARLRSVVILGAGAQLTGVSGGFSGSVFTVDDHATLAGLSIGNGSASDGGGVDVLDTGSVALVRDSVAFSTAIFGGGVFVEGGGSLRVTDSAIFSNQAGFEGGGIYVGAGSGRLRVTGSAVYQNLVTADGGSGAGLFTQGAGPGRRLLANSTVAFNTVRGANGQGGGVFAEGLAFEGDTIADNSAASGGGVYVDRTPSTASDTILAGNRGGNCSAPFRWSSYDLEDDGGASCGFAAANHDIVGPDPQLGGLAANGGPTETMALSLGSAAIGDGNCAEGVWGLSAAVDQRGHSRRFAARGVCDIGAWDSGGSETGLMVDTVAVPAGAVGQPYRMTLHASGGVGGPYTWSATSGMLPPGLTLSPAGVISGTPVRSGTFILGASAADSLLPTPHKATQGLGLTVYPRRVTGGAANASDLLTRGVLSEVVR